MMPYLLVIISNQTVFASLFQRHTIIMISSQAKRILAGEDQPQNNQPFGQASGPP